MIFFKTKDGSVVSFCPESQKDRIDEIRLDADFTEVDASYLQSDEWRQNHFALLGINEAEELAKRVRDERDGRLILDVDNIAFNPFRWSALTSEQQQALADYRQALLGVPQQPGFPHDVVWPTKP